LTGWVPATCGTEAGKIHEAHLDILGDAAQLGDPGKRLLHLDRIAVEALRSRLPVALVHHGPARRADAVALLGERLLEGAAAAMQLHRLVHELGQPGDQRIDLGRSEQALVHLPSTKMA
jgi:hypothetical protein